MKKLLILLLFVFSVITLKAQRKSDIGIIGGTGFYLGDINQEKIFYKPGYNVGFIYRYNFEKRTSFRLKLQYIHQSGSDDDFNTELVGRNSNTFSFDLINPAAQIEYNFFPYLTGVKSYKWTPYMFGGVGYSVVASSSSTSGVAAVNHLNIPFGVGVKVNLGSRLSGGAEWAFNKTFSDRIDGVVPATGETFMFKNDWYNLFELFITYKFFKFAADCPVYD